MLNEIQLVMKNLNNGLYIEDGPQPAFILKILGLKEQHEIPL